MPRHPSARSGLRQHRVTMMMEEVREGKERRARRERRGRKERRRRNKTKDDTVILYIVNFEIYVVENRIMHTFLNFTQ